MTARDEMYKRIDKRLLELSDAYGKRMSHADAEEKLRLGRYRLETHLLREHLDGGRIIVNGNLPVALTFSELVKILRHYQEFHKVPTRTIRADISAIGGNIQVEGVRQYLLMDQKQTY